MVSGQAGSHRGLDLLEQQASQVGPLFPHFIEYGHRAYQTRKTTLPGRMQAEQANRIAGIGVVILTFSRLVDAYVRVLARKPEVFHVAQEMSVFVLRAQFPPVQAEPQKSDGR